MTTELNDFDKALKSENKFFETYPPQKNPLACLYNERAKHYKAIEAHNTAITTINKRLKEIMHPCCKCGNPGMVCVEVDNCEDKHGEPYKEINILRWDWLTKYKFQKMIVEDWWGDDTEGGYYCEQCFEKLEIENEQ